MVDTTADLDRMFFVISCIRLLVTLFLDLDLVNLLAPVVSGAAGASTLFFDLVLVSFDAVVVFVSGSTGAEPLRLFRGDERLVLASFGGLSVCSFSFTVSSLSSSGSFSSGFSSTN